MKFVILVSLVVCLSSFAQAQTQKIAYVESEAIVTNMPDYKKAQSQLQSYTKQLEKLLQQQKDAIGKDYNSVMDSVQKGIMTKQRQQMAEARLQRAQQSLQQEAMGADKAIGIKEKELITPLYDKFDKALQDVAKEQGYTYIVDKKFMLYAVGGLMRPSK